METRFSFRELYLFMKRKAFAILLVAVLLGVAGVAYGAYTHKNAGKPDVEYTILSRYMAIEVSEELLPINREGTDHEAAIVRIYSRLDLLRMDVELYEMLGKRGQIRAVQLKPGIKDVTPEEEFKILRDYIQVFSNREAGVLQIDVYAIDKTNAELAVAEAEAVVKSLIDKRFGSGMIRLDKLSTNIREPIWIVPTGGVINSIRQGVLFGIAGAILGTLFYIILFMLMDYAASTNLYERYSLPTYLILRKKGKSILAECESAAAFAENLKRLKVGDAHACILVISAASAKETGAVIKAIEAGGAIDCRSMEEYARDEDITRCRLYFAQGAEICKTPIYGEAAWDGVLLLIKEAGTTHEEILNIMKQANMKDAMVKGILAIE